MQDLADALERDDPAALLRFMQALDPKRHKAAAKWLVADWKARVGGASDSQYRGSDLRYERWARHGVALAAIALDAKQALAIPAPASWLDYSSAWRPLDGLQATSAAVRAALAQAVIDRGAAWCAQWLALVSDEKKPRPMHDDVILAVVQAHELELPATSVVAAIWAQRLSTLLPTRYAWNPQGPYARTVPALALRRDGERWQVRGEDLLVHEPIDALLAGQVGERAGAMLLQVFDHRDAVNLLQGRYADGEVSELVAASVSQMLAKGAVASDALARAAIAALSRGDSPRAQRLQARLLAVAAPDAALVQAHARVLVSLMASGVGVAATTAQQLLRDADAAPPLPDDVFVEACQVVFARKEKGLRLAQVQWARRRGALDAHAAAAALGLCEALLVDDHALQRDVAQAIEATWPRVAPTARAAILAQVEGSRGILDDALFRALWAACGGGQIASVPQAIAASAHVAPPRPGMDKRAFERAADFSRLPAEVVHALGTASTERDAYQFERAICAAMDALAAGSRAWATQIGERLRTDPPFWMQVMKKDYQGRAPAQLAWMRVEELLAAIERGRPQAFLSTPDFAHGAIAPASLVVRLEALKREGGQPLPIDFLVALLRTEACDSGAVARMRAVGTREGTIAADFLHAGGAGQLRTSVRTLEALSTYPRRMTGSLAEWSGVGRSEVCVALAPATVLPAIEGIPTDWALGFEPETAPVISEFEMVADWITPMLPDNAEALAALHLWGFRRAGLESGTDGGKAIARRLPLLLDAHGPAGPALHLAVLFCLSANDAPVRVVGSDGLVTLLQQRRYDDALARDLLAACIARGSVKPGRLASSLAQVREAGEGEAIWPLVRAGVVASLARESPPAGVADLVDLAVRLATDLGSREPVPEVVAAAAAIKGKPNKLQTQLLRLQAALAG